MFLTEDKLQNAFVLRSCLWRGYNIKYIYKKNRLNLYQAAVRTAPSLMRTRPFFISIFVIDRNILFPIGRKGIKVLTELNL